MGGKVSASHWCAIGCRLCHAFRLPQRGRDGGSL